jgi:hypothetical protein
MKRILLIVTALEACVVAGAPASALAAPPPNTAEASKHFDRGLTLVDEEDWTGALVEFERAYDLDPNYRVLFDIGQCRYQVHDYAGALRAFQRYLADGGEAVPAERRSKVLADVEVLIGAEVRLDDAVVGTTPLVAPLLVSAGLHRITLHPTDGGSTVTREIALTGEEHAEITLDSVPPPPTVRGIAVPNPAAPPPAVAPSLLPAWIAFGVGAAGAAAGAYFGVAAMADKSQLDAQCAGKVCPASSQAILSRAQREAVGATVGVAVGAAGVVTGGIVLVISRSGRPSHRPAMGLLVSPGMLGGTWSF